MPEFLWGLPIEINPDLPPGTAEIGTPPPTAIIRPSEGASEADVAALRVEWARIASASQAGRIVGYGAIAGHPFMLEDEAK